MDRNEYKMQFDEQMQAYNDMTVFLVERSSKYAESN